LNKSSGEMLKPRADSTDQNTYVNNRFKGIVHFEIHFVAYLKGIQDVGVFVSTIFSILIFFGQTVVVYQSYTGG